MIAQAGRIALTVLTSNPFSQSTVFARPPTTDFSQAELFLRFLRTEATGKNTTVVVDSILDHLGTALVIRQQNISRLVTPEQYRTVLLHAGDTVAPALPASEGERGRRGVEGLAKDVWPAIHWGIAHVDLLAERLQQLKHVDFDSTAKQRALSFLPPGAAFHATPFIVMGGRAGASAFDDGEIYFDLLITSYRAALHTAEPFPSSTEISGYFAHEMHHLGLSPIIARTRSRLTLTPDQACAFDFLTFLVLEGSASYLVGPRDLNVMRRSSIYSPFLVDEKGLLATCEGILKGTLHEGLSGEALERAQTPLAGSGWHAAGALMLAAVDKSGGLDAIMPILVDPRQLLVRYVRAGGNPPISAELAQEVAVLGDR